MANSDEKEFTYSVYKLKCVIIVYKHIDLRVVPHVIAQTDFDG